MVAITYGNNFDFSFLYNSPIFKLQQALKNLSEISETISKLQSANSAYNVAQQAINCYNNLLDLKQLEDTYQAINRIQQSCQQSMQEWSAITKSIAESKSTWEATFNEIDLILKSYQTITFESERRAAVQDTIQLMQKVDSVELPEETELQRQASEISDADKEELVAEISEAINQHENWEQRLMALFQTYQSQHPVFALIIKHLLDCILTLIITTLLSNRSIGSVDKTAYLREDPSSSAPVVVVIDKPQDIIILGDVPYYYYVEFQDSSSTEPIHGYISKRSLKNVHPEDPQLDTEANNG